MALTAAELRVIVEAVGTKEARAELERTGQAVDAQGDADRRRAAISQTAGRAIVGATTAIGAGYAASVQNAATFAQELANVNTVARLSESDTAALGDAIQQMSRDTGISTTDLTSAMYDMVSAGTITSEQLSSDLAGSMETVNSAAMLAIGGMGNIAGTTDLLTSALNAYGLEADKAGQVTDIFAVAIEKGKVTADEIGSSLSNVAPIAADAGIELEEISAAYATLTANGVPAAEATTQMRSAMVALLSPNERLKDIMADTGVNFAKVAEEDGLHVALQQLRDITMETQAAFDEVAGSKGLDGFSAALEDNQKELGLTNSEMETLLAVAGEDGVAAALAEMNKMVTAGDAGLSDALGRVEAYNFTMQTTGENAVAFGENLESAMDAAGTASEQAEIAMEGPAEVAKRMAANVLTFMQDVGGPAAESLGPFLLMVNQLGPAMGLPIRAATALGGAVGALGGKIITKGVGPLMTFGTTLAKGAVWFAGFSGALLKDGLTALGNFTIAIGKSIGRIVAWGATLIAHGVANVAKFAASLITQGISALARFAGAMLTNIGRIVAWGVALTVRAVGAVAAFAAAIIRQGIAALIQFGIRLAMVAAGALASFAAAIMTTVIPALIGMATTIFTTAIPAIIALLAPFAPIIAIIAVVVAAVAGLFLAWQNNFLGIRDIAATVWEAITGFISGAIDFITGAISGFIQFISGIWNGVTEKASGVWSAITGIISGAVSGITGIIQSIASVAQGVWDTVSGIFGAISGAAQGVGDVVGGIGGWIGDNVPGFAEGTMDTGEGGLAMLHPHEMVIPRPMADMIRASIRGGTARAAAAPAAPAGNVINVTITQPVRVRQPADVARPLRQLAGLGVFNPRG